MAEKPPDHRIIVSIPSRTIRLEHVACPGGCDLVDPRVRIDDSPSVTVTAEWKDQKGAIHLDPRYGSYENRYSFEIPDGAVVRLLCPHCGRDLTDPGETCQQCSAPMFVLHLPRRGLLEGCLRKGCPGHWLKIVDLDEQFLRMFNEGIQDSYL
jgi:hypothetical protein